MPSDAQLLSDVISMKPPPEYKPEERDVAVEVREARKRDGLAYFNKFCPDAYKTFDLGHRSVADNSSAINLVRQYRYSPKGLLLTGPTGKCKTRVSWQLLKRLYAEEGNECRWYHAMDFFTELHECIKYGRDDAKGWISDVAWRRVVFIDDWGQEANIKSREEWAQSWFFRFLDYRLERRLPLIITTNLTAKDIASKEGEVRSDPLLRRLLEICDVVKFQ